ncbi:MAG TPA: T9SS type A sorting domain-containing protein, partial [Flavobacterium sp.]|nr:T9SS type A sorting domain-containing protein [Flavobacterium sp.]
GGNYNTVTGNVRLDNNNNGCDEFDFTFPFFRLAIDLNAMTTNSSVFTNSLGNYNFYTANEGVYSFIPIIENAAFFQVNPEPGIAILDVIDNSSANLDFCITANGIHPDLEVVIAPVFPARPGFEAVYKIVYKNKGNQVLSQQYGLNFFYNQNLMNFVSASVIPSSQGPGGMQWDYENLMPFESRSIEVTMLINAPTDTNPVNIGDELTFTAVISPQNGDDNVIDNTFLYHQTVVGAFDPNDITCLEGDIVPPSQIGNYLHYFIRFENTGTAEAENIVVKTDIDPSQFDIASLQILSTSHGAYIRMNGNRIEFIFQNIALESGGHGNILLKLKSNSTLKIGDSVANKANIYFDYNFPVETNNVETIFQSLRISNPILDSLLSIYPIPVSEVVNIKSNSNINIKTIELYDIQGRLLQTQLVNSVSTELNLLQRANGMYFIKINTDAGTKVEKLVKE